MREIERKACKVACQHLRRREGVERRCLSLMPEADGNTGFGSSGAPRPLVGGGSGHAHRLQSGYPRRGFENRKAL